MEICSLVREQQNNYTTGTVNLSKYVDWSMYDTIQTIEAYLNSKHITGSSDSLGREKPFFNIVSSTVNIWYRATDIDRKNINFKPQKASDDIPAFVANILLQNWMKRERFGTFLNTWGRSLARYGSSVVKFVKQDGRLIPSVIPWNRLIVDPISFYSQPIIEKLYFTPSELRQKKEYNPEMVQSLIESHDRSTRQTLDGQTQDHSNDFIEVYEVHGEFSQKVYKEAKGQEATENDENIFFPQMHVVSFVLKDDGEYDNYTLYSGRESKSPYMITHLIEEEGRTLAIGAVEYLFDAQWMVNHSAKQMKDYLDLASKLIFQTADTNFVGRNVLTNIETGAILRHQPNMPLTQLNNSAINISAIQSYSAQWQNLSRELTSTPDSVRGNTMPSGTPYSLSALQSENATSLFELMTENKGLAIEDMCREFIIPFLKTQMDTSDEIAGVLDEKGISKIDSMFVPREAIKRYNKQVVDEIIRTNGEAIISPYVPQQAEADVKKELAPLGNTRFFKPSDISDATWKDVLKDFEWTVEVEVTNENTDKQAVLTTLSTALQTIATNPAILQDPNAKMLFNKILTTAGTVSPLELSTTSSTPPATSNPLSPSVMGQPAGALPA